MIECLFSMLSRRKNYKSVFVLLWLIVPVPLLIEIYQCFNVAILFLWCTLTQGSAGGGNAHARYPEENIIKKKLTFDSKDNTKQNTF